MPTANAGNSFVSRAEGKLEGAVRAFSYDFRNKTVLDIGSSTGGFTELALKLGAKKVIAIEKGTRQMKAPLRFDPRVELHEKTDFFDTAREASEPMFLSPRPSLPSSRGSGANSRQQAPKCDKNMVRLASLSVPVNTILADVSFVSLTKILRHTRQFADSETDFLVMLKPQFEAEAYQLKNGVVKNEKMRRDIIKRFEEWLKRNKFIILNKRDNEVVGKNGNKERFYYLKLAK